ncbi:MAG: hypothetical protein ACOYJD_01010 [Christensenellales bacterium]
MAGRRKIKELSNQELLNSLAAERKRLEKMAEDEFKATGRLASNKIFEQSRKVDMIMNEYNKRGIQNSED